jgi:hypothetical protein
MAGKSMLALRRAARHWLEGASDPGHQPIREAVADPARSGVHWRPPSILPLAETRFGAIVNAQAGPLVVGVGGTERSCDARAPAAARRLGPARSADPCPPVRPARESALRRLVQGARPRQRRGHVRGGAGDAGAQRVAPWLTRIATVPTWAAASRPASSIARLDSGESPTGTRIVPEVRHAIRRGPADGTGLLQDHNIAASRGDSHELTTILAHRRTPTQPRANSEARRACAARATCPD